MSVVKCASDELYVCTPFCSVLNLRRRRSMHACVYEGDMHLPVRTTQQGHIRRQCFHSAVYSEYRLIARHGVQVTERPQWFTQASLICGRRASKPTLRTALCVCTGQDLVWLAPSCSSHP